MQNSKELKEPVFLDNVVLISQQEYERLFNTDIAYKLLQAKNDIKNGEVLTHNQVFNGLHSKIEKLKKEGN